MPGGQIASYESTLLNDALLIEIIVPILVISLFIHRMVIAQCCYILSKLFYDAYVFLFSDLIAV